MANNRVGCESGKTRLVDPNNFSNSGNVDDNISVPLEDLNISVQLTTRKKSRTVLTKTDKDSTGKSSDSVRVNFIEGKEINGENVLTTSYTDLTTDLEESNDPEALGITNINIDFNSSFAP